MLEYDIRMLNCANLYYGIKKLMFTSASNSFGEKNQQILGEFEEKLFNNLKLLSYKAFQNNAEMYKACSQLIEKTIQFNSTVNSAGDKLIGLIQNGIKGIDKNLIDLKKLVPNPKKPQSRGKSAEKKYFANKHKFVDENNMNNQNQTPLVAETVGVNVQKSPLGTNPEKIALKAGVKPTICGQDEEMSQRKIEAKIEKVVKQIEKKRPSVAEDDLDIIEEVNSIDFNCSAMSQDLRDLTIDSGAHPDHPETWNKGRGISPVRLMNKGQPEDATNLNRFSNTTVSPSIRLSAQFLKKQDNGAKKMSPELHEKEQSIQFTKNPKTPQLEKPFVKDSVLNSTIAPQHQPILQKSELQVEKTDSKAKLVTQNKDKNNHGNNQSKSPSMIKEDYKPKSPISMNSKDNNSKSPRPKSDNKELSNPSKSPLTSRVANSKSPTPITKRELAIKSPYSDIPHSQHKSNNQPEISYRSNENKPEAGKEELAKPKLLKAESELCKFSDKLSLKHGGKNPVAISKLTISLLAERG